jgi:hypothetical protein
MKAWLTLVLVGLGLLAGGYVTGCAVERGKERRELALAKTRVANLEQSIAESARTVDSLRHQYQVAAAPLPKLVTRWRERVQQLPPDTVWLPAATVRQVVALGDSVIDACSEHVLTSCQAWATAAEALGRLQGQRGDEQTAQVARLQRLRTWDRWKGAALGSGGLAAILLSLHLLHVI